MKPVILALLTLAPAATRDGDMFGESIVDLGTLDKDGLEGFAVSAPIDQSVRVFSRDGEPLNVIRAVHAGEFGTRLGKVDDVGGNGQAKLAIQYTVGDERESRIVVVSPLALSIEDAVEIGGGADLPGPFVCIGDTNRDGVADLAVLAPTEGAVDLLVFSTGDRALLSEVRLQEGPPGNGRGHGCLVRAGDPNGDGVEDVWVGLDWTQPRVLLVSVNGRGILSELRPEWQHQKKFGTSLAVLGDVDDDGSADLAVVAPDETARWPSPLSIPSITVFSGDARRLYRIRWGNPHRQPFDGKLLPVGDVDADGAGDLIVMESSSPVSLRSGRDGRLIRQWRDDDAWGRPGFGTTAATLGDIDGGGHADLAISRVSWYARMVPGSVHVFSIETGEQLYELRIDGRALKEQ